ncbi:MAG TPA: class I SAM-dependent methyltransferase [Dehalococcoidia bacterium]|nr:class I SAM-dependent methyltransferase [Dehalococcoidia bacterium]
MKMLKLEKLLVNSRWSRNRVLKLAKKLLGYIETDDETDFLEIGCGNGEVAKYITRTYRGSVTGIDIDPEQVEIARDKDGDIPNLKYLEADSINLPFENGSFDVVLSFGVLHHIEDWQQALKEIIRVLRHGGYFVCGDIIYPEGITKMDNSSAYSFGLATVDVDEVDSFLEENGFEMLHSSLERSFVVKDYEAVYRKG